MTFNEKYSQYVMVYGIQGLTYEELTVLYNLVGSVYVKLKDKYTILEVIDKLLADFDSPVITRVITEPLAIQVLHLLNYCAFKPSALNCTNTQDIKDSIYKVLDNCLPF